MPDRATRLALSPDALVSPARNCVPYWMPTAYRKSARPKVPSIGEGAAFGTNQPTASATKRTAPTPSEKPFRLISPMR
jgi:hypothetical protein